MHDDKYCYSLDCLACRTVNYKRLRWIPRHRNTRQSAITLFRRVPFRLADKALAFGEGGDEAAGLGHFPFVARHRQRLLLAGHGALKCCVGVKHHAVAQFGQRVGVEDRRLAADHHVHQLRLGKALRQGADFVRRRHRLDEQDVGSGLGEFLGGFDRRLKAVRRRRVGAGHDQRVLVPAGSTTAILLTSCGLAKVARMPADATAPADGIRLFQAE